MHYTISVDAIHLGEHFATIRMLCIMLVANFVPLGAAVT